ncbi:MAG: DUF1659 domain-containing protein [Sarcina sp.]
MELTTITKKSLVLKYEVYNPSEDKNVFTTQKFSSIKTSASDAALKEVGYKLAALVKSDSIFVRKEENHLFD